MNAQVTLTRTEAGAHTRIKSDAGEVNKDYPSWDDALKDAEQLGLLSAIEATAAKALPPGFPMHTIRDIDPSTLTTQGFVSGKASPPQ
jgi:hypothetical protein